MLLHAREWLEQFLPLANGIPSHDTFARVFARLNPEQLQQCFEQWINSVTKALSGQVIALDGKSVRGSFDRNGEQKAQQVGECLGFFCTV
jgi:hypothetical protein